MLYKEIQLTEKGSQEYARLCMYIQEKTPEIPYSNKRKLVLICPGGGYHWTSDREAESIAIRMMGMGYHAAVLRYSCAPARFPVSLMEMARAVVTIREHAEEWNVDADKLIIAGFSAGGHLAASYGVFWSADFLAADIGVEKEMLRPNAMLLCYPVITSKEEYSHKGSFENLLGEQYTDEALRGKVSLEDYVNENTPKCFLWHTYTDPTVPVENSFLFAQELIKHRIPVEMHIYERGGHGLSLASEITDNTIGECYQPECQSWITLAETWLKNV